jgi:hypothetical protein
MEKGRPAYRTGTTEIALVHFENEFTHGPPCAIFLFFHQEISMSSNNPQGQNQHTGNNDSQRKNQGSRQAEQSNDPSGNRQQGQNDPSGSSGNQGSREQHGDSSRRTPQNQR